MITNPGPCQAGTLNTQLSTKSPTPAVHPRPPALLGSLQIRWPPAVLPAQPPLFTLLPFSEGAQATAESAPIPPESDGYSPPTAQQGGKIRTTLVPTER